MKEKLSEQNLNDIGYLTGLIQEMEQAQIEAFKQEIEQCKCLWFKGNYSVLNSLIEAFNHIHPKDEGGNKMQITDYVKPSGTFLKADVVKTAGLNAIFIITVEGKIVPGNYKGKETERLHVVGDFGSESYIFDMSKTNARLVASALGDDTKKWIGHQLELETYKTKNSDGKLVDAINIKSVK